jgi:hypothetical protein
MELVDPAEVIEKEQAAMSEKEFTDRIRRTAQMFGWMGYHTYNSRRSTAGFPDLVMIRERWIVYAELKTMKGRTSKHQDIWLQSLQDVSDYADHMWVWLWRPSDMEGITRFLNSPDQFDEFKEKPAEEFDGWPYQNFAEAVALAEKKARDLYAGIN